MSTHNETLTDNQRAALGTNCREPGCTGVYVAMGGVNGPWVCCTATQYLYGKGQQHKVYRPRGRDGGRRPKAEQRQQQQQTVETHETTPVASAPIAPVGGIEGAILNSIMPHVQAALGKVEVDAEAVCDLVQEQTAGVLAKVQAQLDALAASQPTRLEVVNRTTGTTATVENGHYLLPRLIELLSAGIHVYTWGPAGSGKSTAAMHAAKALGLYYEVDTLDPTTAKSHLQGYKTPTGEHSHTAFSRCYTGEGTNGIAPDGGLYIGEEIDNAPAHVQSLQNTALANGHSPFAWGMRTKGKKFAAVYNGNTPGMPTRAFPDRKPMSAAFKDRLYFLYWPIDPKIEERAAAAADAFGQKWITMVVAMRAWAIDNAPTLMVTPRASLDGLRALAIGETPDTTADALIFRGCDNELRAKVVKACGAGVLS